MSTPAKSLASKLVEVQGEIGHIPKRGRNDHHNYNYVLAADVIDAARKHLAQRNVLLVSSVAGEATTYPAGKGVVTNVPMLYRFIDGDTGETLEVPLAGSGFDTGDKGVYKAYTGALKYLLLGTFLVPTGDDPEADGRTDRDSDAPSERAASPRIPKARAEKIGLRVRELKLAVPLVRAKLADLEASSISEMNVDQAEAFVAFVEKEASS